MPQELTIPQSARVMYRDEIEHVFQQVQERFRPYAKVSTGCTGLGNAHRLATKAVFNTVTGRFQPTNADEGTLIHRFVYPTKAVAATLIDEDDHATLGTAVAPQGWISDAHKLAAATKLDEIFLKGITGTNREGTEDQQQDAILGVGQKVAVDYGESGNAGLTLKKLIRGKSIFGQNEVYGQGINKGSTKLCMAVAQEELDNLLNDVEQIGHADYNKVQALVDGEVDYFMGIHFIRSQQVPKVGNIRSCPMWVSDGVFFDFWYDVKTSINVIPTQSDSILVRSRLKAGSARKQEEAVVLVACDESVALA